MASSISGVYPDSSVVVPLPVQGASTGASAAPPAAKPAAEIPNEDKVTLSQAARVDQLSVLGATPAQIADNLGISLSTVDIDLGIVAATDTVPVTAAPAASGASASGTAAPPPTAAPAAPASPTKSAAAPIPDSATTAPATTTPISPSPAVQTASV